MPLSTDYNDLESLRQQYKVIKNRIALCKNNLSHHGQTTSLSLSDLLKEEKRLEQLIAEYVPHDFTPNPGGSTPAPAVALYG